MPTIIIQADWPETMGDGISLVERVLPREGRDERYIHQLVERLLWAFDDAERTELECLPPTEAEARLARLTSDPSRYIVDVS